jgi:hypothetical protein
MSYRVRTIPSFERHSKPLMKKYPSLRDELKELVRSLMEEPGQGIPLGMGCYKIRVSIASKGKGRSGGARVVTCVYSIEATVWLLTIFDKSDKENISDKELKALVAAIPGQ